MSEDCQAAAIIIAALLQIVIIHFKFRHGNCKEIISDMIKNVLIAESDELME